MPVCSPWWQAWSPRAQGRDWRCLRRSGRWPRWRRSDPSRSRSRSRSRTEPSQPLRLPTAAVVREPEPEPEPEPAPEPEPEPEPAPEPDRSRQPAPAARAGIRARTCGTGGRAGPCPAAAPRDGPHRGRRARGGPARGVGRGARGDHAGGGHPGPTCARRAPRLPASGRSPPRAVRRPWSRDHRPRRHCRRLRPPRCPGPDRRLVPERRHLPGAARPVDRPSRVGMPGLRDAPSPRATTSPSCRGCSCEGAAAPAESRSPGATRSSRDSTPCCGWSWAGGHGGPTASTRCCRGSSCSAAPAWPCGSSTSTITACRTRSCCRSTRSARLAWCSPDWLSGEWPLTALAIGVGAWLVVIGGIWLLTGGRAMGFGDVKLAPVLAATLAWVGVSSALVGLLAAFVLGGVVGIVLMATGRARRGTHMAVRSVPAARRPHRAVRRRGPRGRLPRHPRVLADIR